jgi:hypothetical protein
MTVVMSLGDAVFELLKIDVTDFEVPIIPSPITIRVKRPILSMMGVRFKLAGRYDHVHATTVSASSRTAPYLGKFVRADPNVGHHTHHP